MKKLWVYILIIFSSLIFVGCSFSNYKPQALIQNVSYNDDENVMTFDACVTDKSNIASDIRFDLTVDGSVYSTVSFEGTKGDTLSFTFENILEPILDQYTIICYATVSNEENKQIGSYTGLGWAGITFQSQSYIYDGKKHYLSVSGLTNSFKVEYEGNGQSEVGIYTVYAKVYSTLNMNLYRNFEATLTILDSNGSISLNDYETPYTGSPIEIKYDKSYSYTYFSSDGNQIDEIILPGVYTVHAMIPSSDGSIYETEFTLTVTKANLVLDLESKYLSLDSPYLSSDDLKFNCSNIDYKLTYFDSLGNEIEEIKEEGSYTALIEVEESELYTGLTQAVGLNVGDSSNLNKGLFISQVEYFSIVYSNYYYRPTNYYLFINLYNDTSEEINVSDMNVVVGSGNATLSKSTDKISPYSSYMILISSTSSDIIDWYDTIDLSTYYDYKLYTTSQSLFTNASKIEISVGDYKDSFDFTTAKNTYDDFFANRNYKEVFTNEGALSEYSIKEVSNDTLSLESLGYQIDYLSPVVIINDLSSEISKTYLSDSINMSVHDNYDGDILVTLDMLESGYADFSEMTKENLNKEIKVTYYIKDSSGNKTVFSRNYILRDMEAPYVEITEEAKNAYELEDATPDFKTFFKAYDDYDGEITITDDMIDTSNVNFDEKGVYSIYLNLSDSSGNTLVYEYRIAVGYSKNYLSTYNVSENLVNDGPNTSNVCPSTGNVNVLVIPVSLDSTNESSTIISNIKKAFNGGTSEVAWQSVKSYYETSSYGKLHFNFDVYNSFVRASKSANYYSSNQYELFSEILSKVDSSVDFSKYDSNNSGYIDAVWFVYNIDYYYNNSQYYWAFTADLSSEILKYDGKILSKICFASIDFMDSKDSYNKEFNDNGIVARTYIHETGHLLGLDDYYDYDYDIKVGYSHTMLTNDMMDGNKGDHNALSKLLLGWLDPNVCETSGNYVISPYESGDALLICPTFSQNKTIFREYFILEFYTPEGLNSKDASLLYGNTYGIRVLHCDATINYDSNGNIVSNKGTYPSYFKYDNTDDDDLNFVEVLVSDESITHYTYQTGRGSSTYKYNNEGVLFETKNQVFGKDIYSDFTYNDGRSLDFTFEITDISKDSVTVSVKMK